MADRGASASYLTELGASQNRPIHLLSVETSGGISYLTDAFKDIDYGGNTYLAVGKLLDFTDIEETSTLQVSSITVTLTASDNSKAFVAAFLSYEYLDRSIIIYTAMLDSSNALIADPILFFSGNIDQPVIQEDPENSTATIAVSASNLFIDWENSRARTTNHESQTFHYPGDKGMEFSSEIIKEIFWGREAK